MNISDTFIIAYGDGFTTSYFQVYSPSTVNGTAMFHCRVCIHCLHTLNLFHVGGVKSKPNGIFVCSCLITELLYH